MTGTASEIKRTSQRASSLSLFSLIVVFLFVNEQARAGVIKDFYQKFTGTNNKTQDAIKQSVPICGNGLFSTPDQSSVSPELIFITNQLNSVASRRAASSSSSSSARNRAGSLSNIAREFKFNVDNVTIEELERYGFNRDAPVTFLIHGFTSGYPMQAWTTAIVESYTYDREAAASAQDNPPDDTLSGGGGTSFSSSRRVFSASSGGSDEDGDEDGETGQQATPRRRSQVVRERRYKNRIRHNLFIVNWNYAARGILYPRAVANIPVVASYVTRFINDKLIDEANVDASHIQLIGHSLGAHLSGFVGKNTNSKLGRIYALDPAGPCFGTLAGPLYPSSRRLAADDALEVVSVHTNSALLGIDKPLGKYSVFVEGGQAQPGCNGDNGVLDTLHSLTWDNAKFGETSCSHSRAPNLLSHRHDHSDDPSDNCQMVAYACSDWQAFTRGQCGLCKRTFGDDDGNYTSDGDDDEDADERRERGSAPPPVKCLLVGLDWQYPETSARSNNSSQSPFSRQNSTESTRRPLSLSLLDNIDEAPQRTNLSSSPFSWLSPSSILSGFQQSSSSTQRPKRAATTNAPTRRGANSTEERDATSRRSSNSTGSEESSGGVKPTSMFMRTSDTQPYCTFHYQIVLELKEPFDDEPGMALVLQELSGVLSSARSTISSSSRRSNRARNDRLASSEQNTISADNFGNKYDGRTYTHLLTSARKLKQIDRATMIFLVEGGTGTSNKFARNIKRLHVNYMSHANEVVRRRSSARLCPISGSESSTAAEQHNRQAPGSRVYLAPCKRTPELKPSSSSSSYSNNNDFDMTDYENNSRRNNAPYRSREPPSRGDRDSASSSSSFSQRRPSSTSSNL